MKWPAELLLIRHAESAYNNLKKQKDADPDCRRRRTLLEKDRSNPELQHLAAMLHKRHALGYSDRDTPITPTVCLAMRIRKAVATNWRIE